MLACMAAALQFVVLRIGARGTRRFGTITRRRQEIYSVPLNDRIPKAPQASVRPKCTLVQSVHARALQVCQATFEHSLDDERWVVGFFAH